MTTRLPVPALPLLLVLLSAACAGDATGPAEGAPPAGSFAFQYGGPLSGTFHAAGAAPAGGGDGGTWVVAERDGASPLRLAVRASVEHGDQALDRVRLHVPGEPGAYVAGCREAGCAALEVQFGTAPDASAAAGYACEMVQGMVEVVEVADGVLRGGFSGVAVCRGDEAGPERYLALSRGEFSAPVRDL